jgi:hypothetical protein
MGNSVVALYIIGALFTLYVVAATSLSKDADAHASKKPHMRKSPSQAVDRRVVHWWRARRRKSAPTARPQPGMRSA